MWCGGRACCGLGTGGSGPCRSLKSVLAPSLLTPWLCHLTPERPLSDGGAAHPDAGLLSLAFSRLRALLRHAQYIHPPRSVTPSHPQSWAQPVSTGPAHHGQSPHGSSSGAFHGRPQRYSWNLTLLIVSLPVTA